MQSCSPCLSVLLYIKKESAGAGFTLLELLIVLALVSLVAGIATVFFVNALPASKLGATARDISSTIRTARTMAQTNNKPQVVTIDLDSRHYGIEGRGDRDIPPGIYIKVLDPLAGEVSNGTYQMRFNAYGAGGGTVIVWNSKKSVTIQVDPVTGPVVTR